MDAHYSVASGLADKGREQIIVEDLACHFAKLGGPRLPGIKVRVL